MIALQRIFPVFIVILLSFCSKSPATIIYVDKSLNKNITNGSYSIKYRNNSGNCGNAFMTIQEAINTSNSGDTIYIRGGRYFEHISFPNYKQGTERKRNLIQSYPGEWSIIDGGYKKNKPVILYKDGGHEYCPSYWTFRCFEITGGGTKNGVDGGGGIRFDTAHHLIFEYLYIHNNYGGNGTNDGGIVIENDTQGAQNIIIRYCYIKDNTDADGGNCANISLFSDYIGEPRMVDIKNARKYNEIYYNYIVGSEKGIKNKAEQYLCLDVTGEDSVRYRNFGDKYHHNIIVDYKDQGITARQDFVQVYNNVVNSNKSYKGGISLGSGDYDTEREPFYACVYNNILIGAGSDGRIEHLENGVYAPPLRPFVYFYNNIFESIGPEHNGRNDLNIFFTWNLYTEQDVDMKTVQVENNLFIPRSSDEDIIGFADDNNNYSAMRWRSAGYSKVIYTSSDIANLHDSSNLYKCNNSFQVGSGKTIADGGKGGMHPYLKGIKIPLYIGAANPKDNKWIDGVLQDITNVEWLKSRHAGGHPDWIEEMK